jgi:hypothetical protein
MLHQNPEDVNLKDVFPYVTVSITNTPVMASKNRTS